MNLRRIFIALVLTGSLALAMFPAAAADTGAPRLTFLRVAGADGGPGFEDGVSGAARFNQPAGVARDGSGNVYVADLNNHTIRKIKALDIVNNIPVGSVTTLAGLAGSSGSEDGTGGEARFHSPASLAVDSRGNIFVADRDNSTIRKITPGGTVTTLAGRSGENGSVDGPGDVARFNQPWGVTVDSSGNVYVADSGSHTIRKITTSGIVSTIAGLAFQSGSADGNGSAARFFHPQGIAVDASGTLYVADTYNSTVRKIRGGVVTTLAGVVGSFGSTDGTGSAALFYEPAGITIDSSGDLYVADLYNEEIRKITPSGTVTTYAGQGPFGGNVDGTGNEARFRNPLGLTVDAGGLVWVADTDNHSIRLIGPDQAVTTLAGTGAQVGFSDGTGSAARFNNPSSLSFDSNGNLFVADSGNHIIRKITAGGSVTTLAGTGGDHFGSADGVGGAASFFFPDGVATDSSGNVYVTDSDNHTIRKITPSGVVTTLAGLALQSGTADGTGSAARFNFPIGIAVDSSGNVYVADYGNYTIRKITPAGMVTTLAGLAGQRGSADGSGSAARFSALGSMAADVAGNIYVADIDNRTIRKITPAGVVTTLAGLAGQSGSSDGTGVAARFSGPEGVATDSSGNVYVADTGNNAIRKITPAGVVTTLAGSPSNSGEIDGTGAEASFDQPWALAVDSSGNIWIAARFTNSIRMGKAALPDAASIDSSAGTIDATRHLFASPSTAASWQWSVIRRPPDSTATVSPASSANPTIAPEVPGLYMFRLVATGGGTTSITTIGLEVDARNRAVRH